MRIYVKVQLLAALAAWSISVPVYGQGLPTGLVGKSGIILFLGMMIRSHKNHSIDEVPPPLNGKPGDPSKRYPHLTHLEHQVNQILSQSIAQCDSKSSIQNIFEIGPKTEYIHLTNKFKPWVTNNSLVCNPGQGETACMKIKDEGSKQLLMIFIRDPQVRNYLNEKYPNHSSEVPTAFKYIKALSD